MKIVLSLLAALVLPMPSASAQEYTDDQLLELFEQQREAFREAREGGLGQTRGLRLLDVEDVSAEAATSLSGNQTEEGVTIGAVPSASAAPPGSSGVDLAGAPSDAAVSPTTPEAPVVAAAADGPLVFGALDPSLQVNLNIEFGFDSAVIDESQVARLSQMCSVMKRSDVELFRIVGHTDAAGSDTYNEQLSMLRAREVARYLVNVCGLEPARLETVGLGERFLANPSEPRADENRRVEFQALS